MCLHLHILNTSIYTCILNTSTCMCVHIDTLNVLLFSEVHADAIVTMTQRYGFRTAFIASDDASVPHQLRLLLDARGMPQSRLKVVTVGEGRGEMGDRSQVSPQKTSFLFPVPLHHSSTPPRPLVSTAVMGPRMPPCYPRFLAPSPPPPPSPSSRSVCAVAVTLVSDDPVRDNP